MTPLSAFWHRTRKQYVPLTADEWDAKAYISRGDRQTIARDGLVTASQSSGRDGVDTIYEITPAGIEAHRASLMGGAA